MSETKTCTKCGVCKPFDAFAKQKKGCGGLRSQCRECCAISQKEWRANSKDHCNSYASSWRERNPQKHVAQVKRWREQNPEKYRAQHHTEAAAARRAKAHAAAKDQLLDRYVRMCLKGRAKIPSDSIPTSLIDLKREQLLLHRLAKTLQGAANQSKENT
ncbi:hypothetical protein [Hydrogenophaga sp.]|uniref:hypothetical protein n=1 Tax=Hydrogenophaga sp. TaxID=1904254 RepID=UPI003F6E73F7